MTTAERVTTVAFWVLLAAGLALRIGLVFTQAMVIDSDRAIVFLISKHISEGDVVWFFWGQTYGGTLLEFAAAAAMTVFGAHIEVLAVVSITIFAGSVLVVRHLVIEAMGSSAGNVAAALFWFSGVFTLSVSISDPGFYGPSLLLGLGATALALSQPHSRPYVRWAVVGLLTGLALWQSPMGAALALPGTLVLCFRERSWRRCLVGATALGLGALPWLIELAGDTAVVTPLGNGTRPSLRGFVTFFTSTLPSIVGGSGWPSALVGSVIALALFALLAVLTLRQRNVWLGALLCGSLLSLAVVVLGSGIVLSPSDYRYTVFVLPSLCAAVGYIATRRITVAPVVMGAAVALTLVQLGSVFPDLKPTTTGRYVVGDIGALSDYLHQNSVEAAYGDYWIAYAVTAASDEATTVASLSAPRRYVPYEAAAARATPVTVIVLAANDNDRWLQSDATVPQHRRVLVADYAVYTFQPGFDPYSYHWNLY